MDKQRTFQISQKVAWEVDISKTWEEVFYPSSVKRIKKSDEYYSSLFTAKEILLTKDIFHEVFYPVYKKEIMARSNYGLNKEDRENHFLDLIASKGNYYLHGIFENHENVFAGGAVYAVYEKSISIALRAYDSRIKSQYKKNISIDYWSEAKMHEQLKTFNLTRLLHGRDSYPNEGRIGLPYFKLQVGSKPILSNALLPEVPYTLENLQGKTVPVLFFQDADKNGFYKSMYVVYDKSSIQSDMLTGLEKVSMWAGLNFYPIASPDISCN